MDSTHTPGPWTIEDPMGPESLWIVEAGKQTYEWRCIAMVCRDDDIEASGPKISARQQNANARLIAAAPALYAALTNILALAEIKYGNLHPDANAEFARARAALSAATGEAG